MSIPRVRDDLEALEGYHSPQVDAEVRLNTNESPYAPPPGFDTDLATALGSLRLNRYPDRSARALRTAIAEIESSTSERVFAANGSNEVLQCLLLAFGGAGRTSLVFEPTYALHSHISRMTGTQVVSVPRDPDFRIDAARVVDAIAEHEPIVTFLCSPNNPTGLLEPLETVRAGLDAGDGLVVVDEAYGQFAPESAASLFGDTGADRLVVTRTFSKTWGLAGARLGYALADPRIVAACFDVALPYHLSSLAQAAGLAVLSYGAEMEAHVSSIVAERDRLIPALRSLGLEVVDSHANFVLFRPVTIPAAQLWAELLDRSILIRDCSTWRALEGFLRVTIGTAEENERFLAAVEEIVR
jgi:histidinol-phosphate aminotransferase